MNIFSKPLKLLISVVAIIFLVIIFFLSFGFRLDLSPWRQTIIEAANDSLPYQLSLDGDMEATLGFHPSVRLSGIRLAQESTPNEPVVTIGYVSAQVALLPLLRNTIDIDHVLLDSVDIHLEKDAQGETNWQAASESLSEDVDLTGEQGEYSPASLPGYQLKIENKIALNHLNIVYRDDTESVQFDAAMESLAIAIDASNSLTVNAHGTIQQAGLQEEWQLDSQIALDSLLNTQQGKVSLKAALADIGVTLDGAVNLADNENSELTLKARVPTSQIIEKVAGKEMALLTPISVKSQIVANPNTFHLNDLNIAFADSQLNGVVHMEQGDLPIVEGSLTMDQFDLTPWLALEKDQIEASDEPEKEKRDKLDDETLFLVEAMQNWLNSAEIDFDFSLANILGLPVPVKETQLAITMHNGKLHAPASLTLADMPLSGQLSLTAEDDDQISLNSSLTSQTANIGSLFSALLEEDAKGHVEKLSLELSARGGSASELLNQALLDFELSNGRLTIDQNQQWKLRTATARLGLNRDTNIQMDAELLDIPFKLDVQADPLIGLKKGTPWQLHVNADSPAFTGKVEGFVSEKGLKEDSRFVVELEAEKLGALSRWLNVEDDSNQSMRIAGELVQQQDTLSASLPEIHIGETSGEASFDWDTSSSTGIANLKTHFTRLNLDELVGLLPEPEEEPLAEQTVADSPSAPSSGPRPGPAPGPAAGPTPGSAPGPTAGPAPGPTPSGASSAEETGGVNLNAPLLGKHVRIPDANIDFRIDELNIAGQTSTNLNFTGEIRDSQLKPSPFSAEFAGSRFYGDLALDLRDQTVVMEFDLGVDQPDFGRILTELNVISDMDLSLDQARFSLNLKGKTIGELIQQVRMNANLEGGMLRLTDANTGATSEVLLNSGSITAQPNMRLTLKMDGELKELPVELEVSFNPLSRLLTSRKNVTMQLSVRVPDVHLLSYSVVNLPLDQRTMRLGIILRTPNLNALNPLLDVDMPPLGPVEMHGRFGVNPDGYEIRQSTVNIGDTRLVGDLKLVTTGEKPDLAIHLSAPTIQLDDFKLGDWKAWNAADNEEQTDQQEVVEAKEKPTPASNLISAETMNALNASFKIDVDEVLSGKDRLGEGKLRLNLEQGYLNLNPLFVALPGGEIYATGHLKPVDEGFNIVLQSNIDRFDYGVMARRIDPNTNMQGEVSFNIDIDTTAATPDDLFSHARGNFGFAVWPRDFEAGIIDLWAVGLVSAVLPRIGPEDPSQLNCAVGTFNLEGGQMSDIALMLDTSQMQVAGHSSVNFTDKEIELVLAPRAKTAQIFGFSLPIRVRGSFTDFGFGVPSGEAILTTLRFVTSPVVAPISWIFQDSLDADGSNLCQQIYNQSRSFSPLQP